MPRYRVAEIRLHLGDRWLELSVELSTALAIDPPDPVVATWPIRVRPAAL